MAEIFVDTAHLDEIREAAAWGILDGVTTNPTLMFKAGTSNRKEQTLKIIDIIGGGSVSAEVISTDAPGIIEEAREILSWSEHVYVKIPTIPEGLKAMKEISSWPNGRINATLIFSANQAYLAAKAGADYASIFVGRLDDAGADGLQVIQETRQIFDNYGLPCKVLSASIRNTYHVTQSLLLGADILTMPYAVLEKMISSPHTDVGLAGFLEDWNKIAGK